MGTFALMSTTSPICGRLSSGAIVVVPDSVNPVSTGTTAAEACGPSVIRQAAAGTWPTTGVTASAPVSTTLPGTVADAISRSCVAITAAAFIGARSTVSLTGTVPSVSGSLRSWPKTRCRVAAIRVSLRTAKLPVSSQGLPAVPGSAATLLSSGGIRPVTACRDRTELSRAPATRYLSRKRVQSR